MSSPRPRFRLLARLLLEVVFKGRTYRLAIAELINLCEGRKVL
jgi:hypothetical protein